MGVVRGPTVEVPAGVLGAVGLLVFRALLVGPVFLLTMALQWVLWLFPLLWMGGVGIDETLYLKVRQP